MNTRAKSLYDAYVVQNYGVAPLTLVRGKGRRVWDDCGKRYLDFSGGIAVTALGHAHPKWVRCVCEQAKTLAHCSNLFRNEPQGELAKRLVDTLGEKGARAFFCNSGTEANEALIKLARLHGMRKAGGKEGKIFKIVVAKNSFHGRTFGGMAATAQEKIQHGFRPMLEGFVEAPFNDLDAFKAAVDAKTCAVLVETIQGESGVTPATREFLRGLRKLCTERNVLLMLDEVQCGVYRSGAFLACERLGVTPDAVSLAKGLGGGFPIGAIWMRAPFADLFQPGMHGTTFGGNPLACAAALAVLETVEAEALPENVRKISARLVKKLNALRKSFPLVIDEVRGMGLMLGVGLKVPTAPLIARLRELGLLVVGAGNQTVRLLPALNVTEAECDEAVRLFKKALETLELPTP